MTYQNLLYSVADGIATLTLNRPDKYNAFTTAMIAEAVDALQQAASDDTVRAIILIGSGKAFCSGQDLNEFADLGPEAVDEHLRRGYNVLIKTLRTIEKPVIGAINGVAAGAGSSIALACDLRLGSEQTSFAFGAFINIGLIPDSGLTFTLPRLVGMARAFEWAILVGSKNRVDAQTALSAGILMKVVPSDQLLAETEIVARRLAQLPTRAIGLTKRALNRAWDNTLEESLELEAQLQAVASKSQDFIEGVTAFHQKREPQFAGR